MDINNNIGRGDESNPGTISHSRRVAAWCEELGRAQELSTQELGALCNAGLTHHQPELLAGSSMAKLMNDLGISLVNSQNRMPLAHPLTGEILAAFQDQERQFSPRVTELARLLDVANCLDEQLEYSPYQDKPQDEERTEEMIGFAVQHLRMCSGRDLMEVLPKLPVYPAAAMRLHRMLESEISLGALDNIARSDPVLAGKLIKAANSAFYSPSQPIRSVAQAISHIGTYDARRILLTSSIQPLYASPRMRTLWKHSVEAAPVAEKIARVSGQADPAEAFLLGLLHDIGKLAISLLPKRVNQAIDRLLAKGCEPAAAEMVLCGFDHAEAGAEVLRHWEFEEELISAVRYHHRPERAPSALASILYLTEFWTDSEEDLPSNARLSAALERTLPGSDLGSALNIQ